MVELEQRINLGLNGPSVATLGVGTWQWGDRFIWGYGRGYGEADIAAAFEASLAAGLRLFDTAELYSLGKSERLLGRLVAQTADRPPDQRPLIASKFFPYPWRFRGSDLRRALAGSRRRLGVERIDLYQIHWPLPPVPITTWLRALADAALAGEIGAIGVSNYSAEQTRRSATVLAARGLTLASNQVDYSLLNREIERNGVLDACRQLGVTVIAYSPLGSGLLSGKYTPTNPPSGRRRALYHRKGPEQIAALTNLLREIGQAHANKTPAQVALNWLICQNVLPIPGAKTAQQAGENAASLGWRLTPDELSALDTASTLWTR
jgi:aryl-alcohol dehydrogenase-like predicted oxidoreductase